MALAVWTTRPLDWREERQEDKRLLTPLPAASWQNSP
jgi:hypothetical protein